MRQPAEMLVRAYAVTHPTGEIVPPQAPGWDQLVYAVRGVMRLRTRDGLWVVPPHRAVWVPAGLEHRLDTVGRLAIRTLYFPQDLALLPARCRAVNVPPLLRELILHVHQLAPLDLREPAHIRLVGVIGDLVRTLPDAPLRLPEPQDRRARAAADLLGADPRLPLDNVASSAGASRRTLERLFTGETGLGLGAWRSRLRIADALRRLAAGQSVTTVSLALGYATPSAFTAMFTREMGVSPTRYFAPQAVPGQGPAASAQAVDATPPTREWGTLRPRREERRSVD